MWKRGLDWIEVKPLIESAFAQLPDVRVIIFGPTGAPGVEKILFLVQGKFEQARYKLERE